MDYKATSKGLTIKKTRKHLQNLKGPEESGEEAEIIQGRLPKQEIRKSESD